MGRFVDRSGQKYWRTTLVSPTAKRGNGGSVVWLCLCECGNKFESRSDMIMSGHIKSCGCLSTENKSAVCIKRNTTHNMSWKHKLYGRWVGMHRRCKDEKFKSYPDYGGRGIQVCEEWSDYKTFYDWAIENGFSENLEIDRIDNNGNYCPNNCQFITKQENLKNKRHLYGRRA
jgi:hypothetical protein